MRSENATGLEAGHDALLSDLCPIPEVDTNDLFDAVLAKNLASQPSSTFSSIAEPSFSPVVTEAIIDHVAKELRDQSILTADNRWAYFLRPPREMRREPFTSSLLV